MSPLRILALHGCGTNAAIWRAQSAALRSSLPKEWEYEFVDGAVPCGPASSVDAIYPPPYCCYYDIPTLENVEAAHGDIDELIEDSGPFDAVIGFSQGAALAASMILHHQAEHPFAPALFRFAIFVGGSLPYSKSQEFGVDIAHAWQGHDHLGNVVYTPNDDDTDAMNTIVHKKPKGPAVRRFTPRTHVDKIEVPTAHITGKADPYHAQSLRLLDLCDQRLANVYEHTGAHVVPHKRDSLQACVQAIMRTFERAQFMSV